MKNKAVQEEIKKKLLARKKSIEKALKSFAAQDDINPNDFHSQFPDIGAEDEENALEVAMYSDRISLENVLEKILRDINAALENMKNGTYGICKYCDKEISEARLRARPVSSACVKCKEAFAKRG